MSFRADIIRSVRFDETLRGVPPGEDVDFCVRLPSDTLLVLTPRARIAHNQTKHGRSSAHWLRHYVHGSHYLYLRHWRHGLKNRLHYGWFNVGCALVATFASLRRRSLEPWQAFLAGMRGPRTAMGRAR
jgi:GT2 family glycosyltransferase